MKIKNKTSHQHMTALLATLGVCLLIMVFVYKFFYPKQLVTNNISKQTSESRRYYSKGLRFSIEVPSEYAIEERFTAVKLTKNNSFIDVSRSGTNYKDIAGYVNTLEELNKLSIQEREAIEVDGLQGMKAILRSAIKDGSVESIFFIYKDFSIYTFSTSTTSLYNDLDTIARSFRYTTE